jgi:HK97 family phage major capsid protein/HK97 family phage prohead protease
VKLGQSVTTRAYSLLEVKSVDDERFVISGLATTPEVDRVGDVVESTGAKFNNPLPLLLHHDARLPVGTVRLHKPTKHGIEFTAQLAKVDEPGTLRERVLEAWQSVKAGLIRGVSIGFRSSEDGVERMDNGGLRFTDFEILELSLVAIPANASATISAIKSIDAQHLAASGNEGVSDNTPRVRGTHASARKGARHMKTYSEQIKQLEVTRADKIADRDAIQTKALDEGRGKDEAEREQFTTLTSEIKAIDEELDDLRMLEKEVVASAKPVVATSAKAGSESRDAKRPHISVTTNVPKGIGFARAVMCQLQARMDGYNVLEVAKARYPDHAELHNYLTVKATVPAGTTTQTVWASPLVYASNLASEFVELLQPQTIVGKFGTGNVPSLTRVPFNVRVPRQTGEGFAGWVGEGVGKPVTSAAFDSVTVSYHKLASIAVLTKELVRFSTPSAEMLVKDMLAKAIIRKLDDSFIDPSFAASTGVNPASITNGLTAQTSAGVSADNARTDLANLIQAYLEANYDPTGLVIIMPPTLAMALSLMRNSLGQKEFGDITATGGTLEGFPVITSQHAANSSGAGNMVIMVRAADIFLADDGGVSIDASEQASVQMSDTPTINSTTGTGASLVSLWQTNSVGVRAEREISWTKARSGAVVYMDDVNWGSIGSPA